MSALSINLDATIDFMVGLLNTPSPTGYHLEAIDYVRKAFESKYGEKREIIHAMECHHGDYDPTTVEAGATAVIQPGGSIRDDEVIAAADEAGLAMVFTGMRHFRH